MTDEQEQTLEASEEARKKADPLIGQLLAGNYEVLDILGEGGMAVVYKGKQVSTERIVALKTLKTRDVNVMRRFQREMQTHGRLNHRNIVEAIDCFEHNEQSFLVMECVSGISLLDLIQRDGGLENEETFAAIIMQICDALDHAHGTQLIHRDLKPANVILVDTPNNETLIKVLDFGIAKLQDDMQKLTAEGQAMGSPLYMSPEQCMGQDLSPRADTYSLGILAYELITGNLPYEFPRLVQVMQAHCDPNTRPKPLATHRPEIKGISQIEQIIMRAVESDPDKRFQTAGEFKKAIEFWIQGVRGGSTKALPEELVKAAPKKVDTADKEHEKQTKAAQALVEKNVKGRAAQAGQKPDMPDTTKLIINFSLGLVACCVCLGIFVGLWKYSTQVKSAWTSASLMVSQMLSKKQEPTSQPKTEEKPASEEPNNQSSTNEVQPNEVPSEGDLPPGMVLPAKQPTPFHKKRRIVQ